MKRIEINEQRDLIEFFESLQNPNFIIFPSVITIENNQSRSLPQNNMTFEIYQRIGKTLYGGDHEHARYECKLRYGIPILRRDSPEFSARYDTIVRPLNYETKIELMEWFPVTSAMKKKQLTEYIDTIINQYTLKGVAFGDL